MDYTDNQDETDLLMQLMADPDIAEKLAQMGIYGDQQALLGQQMKRADANRFAEGAQGRNVGNTYVAASPLEHLGLAMQRFRGEREAQDAMRQQQGIMANDVSGRRALADAMVKAMRQRGQMAAPTEDLGVTWGQ